MDASIGRYPNSEVESLVKIKIGSLEGKVKRYDYEKLLENPIWQYSSFLGHVGCGDLKVKIELYANSKPICLPVSTSYKSFSTRWNWNEWVHLPIRFCDLPHNAQFCITIYDCGGPSELIPVGGTTISVFTKQKVFREGMLDLRVWPGLVADGSQPSTTPGKGTKESQMYKLNKMAKKHRLGKLQKLDWLDRLTFSEIETICEKEKRASDMMFLNVEFPVAEFGGNQYAISYLEKSSVSMSEFSMKPDGLLKDYKWIPDHEILLDNLVENKHHTLSRCVETGFSDAELKPNAETRDLLNAIVNYPPTKTLSAEERDLIWKFRYCLRSNKKALAKFLKCVKWDMAPEERLALDLLNKWAPMDFQDALELLGPTFTHSGVRRYAVARLKQAPDDDLLLYLLQLVQALKYENFDQINDEVDRLSFSEPKDSSPSTSLITDSPDGENSLTSIDHSKIGTESADASFKTTKSKEEPQKSRSYSKHYPTDPALYYEQNENVDLATFLIYRACENTTLANYFYWYLFIECEDHDEIAVKQDKHIRIMYENVMKRFIKCLKRGKPEWQNRRALLSRQQKLITKLVEIAKAVAKENVNRPKKVEKLQALLGETDVLKLNLTKFDPLPFPLDPEVHIQGVLAKEAALFKSSQMPCKLVFSTTGPEPYIAIFKHGDDLRQDQLVLQIITLMDKLLRKENLDLRLSPYRVLATSTTHGFVQFIPSTTVADVLASEGTILNFFRKHNPSENDWNGISPIVMDTYVKSCAGYCVITYLLGVGDRHLDNLLLTTDGKLFHIDFGYILGRDPKPMPPPMKLSKEMVEAMGGINSEYYQEFRKLCYTAFLHLRRHANLILNLFSLMVGASVPDIALEPDKTVKKVLDKFQLDLNDEAAVKYMQEVIDVSVTAVMPALLEQMHKFTQMLRK